MGAEECAQILVRDVFRLHGIPQFLVSDRDELLTSKLFAKVSELLGIRQRMSTASHPQTDRQTAHVYCITQTDRQANSACLLHHTHRQTNGKRSVYSEAFYESCSE